MLNDLLLQNEGIFALKFVSFVKLESFFLDQSIHQDYLMNTSVMLATPTIQAGFHALSDPWRLQIIELLRSQELCVCELMEKLEISQSKLSFHLKILKEAGLVQTRQEGRWIYYRLNLAQFVLMEEYFANLRRYSSILPGRSC
jgi:ArsR family transcriptional regulator